jgi:hypothetical protein
MISVGYRNPLYDGTTAAINPDLPTEINPPIIPAADELTKLTTPSPRVGMPDRGNEILDQRVEVGSTRIGVVHALGESCDNRLRRSIPGTALEAGCDQVHLPFGRSHQNGLPPFIYAYQRLL